MNKAGNQHCLTCGMNIAGIDGHKCNGYVPPDLNPKLPRSMVEQVVFFDRIFQRLDAIDLRLNDLREDLSKKRRVY